MATTLHALVGAGIALVFWTCIGLPMAARVVPRSIALLLAPAIGWAAHSALALPVLAAIGMSRVSVAAVFLVPCILALALQQRNRVPAEQIFTAVMMLALLVAAVLAITIMAAVLPKFTPGGVALASPIFDHSKIAMIDEMVRAGVPPANPFFGGEGPARLTYYYLWHFSAAELAVFAGITGWEADAALTGFTALAALAMMMALALLLGGKPSAALWVVIIAATGSIRPVLYFLVDEQKADLVAGYPTGFGGWLFQTSWAPQHAMAGVCAVLGALLLVELMQRPRAITLVLFSLIMAAGFESSTWVGGVAFGLAAVPITLLMLWRADPAQRLRAAIFVAIAVVLALLLIAPFLYDQLKLTALRASGAPIIFRPYEIVDDIVTDRFGDFINVPVYWLVFLPVEFPAFYLAGIVTLVYLLKGYLAPDRRGLILSFAILIAISLAAGGNLVSTLGENNDLGWRSVLPAILLLIVFAAVGLSRLVVSLLRPLSLAAIALVVAGIADGGKIIENNVLATSATPSKEFLVLPAVWQAVRSATSPNERVVNNPEASAKMTPWSVNLPWALMADRRSCFANVALVGPLSALAPAESERISAQFVRVFAGKAEAKDVEELAKVYHCDTAVLTPEDGAWTNDPFAASPFYKLADGTAAWRIYRAAPASN
jgi:hypothetical protein